MTDLGTLGFVSSGAEGINPAGQVIGQGETAQGETHGFLWDKGVITDLGPLSPRGINPAGQVVVNSTDSPGHALLWVKGVTTDLGSLGGSYSFAEDIDASGQVVGASNTTTTQHAFLWANGVMTDLGTLGENFILSYATGISPSGQIVGSSETAAELNIRAFVWERGVMTGLKPLDGTLYSRAHDINSAGLVVGESLTASNQVHATLWTRK